MRISEKIEQIRLQPEHIRLRYIWGSVAVSMVFILAVWIFSIGSLFQGDKNGSSQSISDNPNITDQLQTLKEQAPSIKDFTDQASALSGEGIANTNNNSNATDFQYPAALDENAAPQASAYSDLPTNTPAQQN